MSEDQTKDAMPKEAKQKITIPDLGTELFDDEYLSGILGDFNDLNDLERSQHHVLKELVSLTNQINEEDALYREAKLLYDRRYKRLYLSYYDVKPESQRRIRAEVKCEDLEDKWIEHEQRKQELERKAYALRDVLRAFMASGNNLRQHLRVM